MLRRAQRGRWFFLMILAAGRRLFISLKNKKEKNNMLLKEGDRGATVASLQRGLRMMCCDPNGLDGIFGPGCTAAVKKWQGLQGLEQTGL